MLHKRLLLVSVLSTACYSGPNGGENHEPREFDDLKQEYDAKAQDLDQCLGDFDTCAAGLTDAAGILACSDALQTCLGSGLPGGGLPGGGLPGGGSSGGGGSGGGSDSGGESGGGDDCQALLDACLADPSNLDPSCLTDFQSCMQGETDSQLGGLCDDLVGQCQAAGLPVDCSTLCP